MSWGWKLPFLASALAGILGLYVRLRRVVEDASVPRSLAGRRQIEHQSADGGASHFHPRNFLVLLGARMAENGLGYLFPVFGPRNNVVTTLGVPRADALSALIGAGAEYGGAVT